MPPPTILTPSQLSRLIGLPEAPAIIEVRIDEDFDADPQSLPGSVRLDVRKVSDWAHDFTGRPAIVVCQRGLELSQGAAAESIEAGFDAWRDA